MKIYGVFNLPTNTRKESNACMALCKSLGYTYEARTGFKTENEALELAARIERDTGYKMQVSEYINV